MTAEVDRGNERVARWVNIRSMKGGWIVNCALCGKDVTRTFHASVTDYATAERESREYALRHHDSAGHRAGIAAFFSREAPTLSPEESILNNIFGLQDAADEKALRKRAAKDAAARVRRDEFLDKQAAKLAALPICPVCELPVSMKDDREEDRRQLPSDSYIHTKCLP